MRNCKPVLVIHGGAVSGRLSAEKHTRIRASLEQILASVYPELERGRSATEVCALAVAALENDPLYNAGHGSKIQSDGRIRMSASLMDGHRRRFGGCVNVQGVKNPIYLARQLMSQKDRVLSEQGAARMARTLGLAFASPFTQEQRKEYLAKKSGKTGTVGAVVLDRQGRLAAATSTGGRGYEYPHRVSDSPTVAGNFANRVCAVSATGVGEQIIEFGAAATICAYVEMGLPLERAVTRVLSEARRARAQFGLIGLNQRGDFVAQTTTRSLIWAAARTQGLEFMRP